MGVCPNPPFTEGNSYEFDWMPCTELSQRPTAEGTFYQQKTTRQHKGFKGSVSLSALRLNNVELVAFAGDRLREFQPREPGDLTSWNWQSLSGINLGAPTAGACGLYHHGARSPWLETDFRSSKPQELRPPRSGSFDHQLREF
ncbi:uncharacterized protein LOC144595617 [Rhinoraja longicauda]